MPSKPQNAASLFNEAKESWGKQLQTTRVLLLEALGGLTGLSGAGSPAVPGGLLLGRMYLDVCVIANRVAWTVFDMYKYVG